jgi:DNA-binding NarL/FixJ family response regulator
MKMHSLRGTARADAVAVTGGRRAPAPTDGARTLRFWHEGHELMVLSVPLQRASRIALTRAELEVARSIVQGESNAAIAHSRGTSVRTVANQVASILQRLGVASRAQVAAKLVFVDLERKR